jgi:hypothetical protein
MIITMENYKSVLPEYLHNKFISMIDRAYGRAIIYMDQILRYTNVDEY